MREMLKTIMMRAHQLARQMEGDYAARLALGLRQAWREVRMMSKKKLETIIKTCYRGYGWIARVTGRDEKYGLARKFLGKRDVTERKSNVYRKLEWVIELEEGVIYEFCWRVSSGQEDRGFWQVRGGQLVKVEYQDVLEAVS